MKMAEKVMYVRERNMRTVKTRGCVIIISIKET